MNKKLIIFGSTGYIGNLVLNQLDFLHYKIIACSYHNNLTQAEIIKEKYNCDIFKLNNYDEDEIKMILNKYKPDIIVNAMSGWNGFFVSYYCLKNKYKLILANKESIVIGYQLLLPYRKQIIPIDSEHTALYELCQYDYKNIDEIYITASGGKYYHETRNELINKNFSDTVKHPHWNMGEQISIDSSTMVNKFYELIEATFFYPNIKIIPIYHKQSIVHAIVKYKNNSYLFNCSMPDMNISVNLALNLFNKSKPTIKPISFKNLVLDFDYIDYNRFIILQLFDEFVNTKNIYIPIIVNITNEYLFLKYKNHEINFIDIDSIILKTVNKYKLFFKFKKLTINDLIKIKDIIIDYLKGNCNDK